MGLVEADRRIDVHNNVYYWSDDIKNHWKGRGDQFPDPVAVFMNSRTQAMFDDDTNYPLLDESNNIEANPEFKDVAMWAEVDTGFAKYGNLLFDSFIGGPAFDGYLHHYPGGDGVDQVIFLVEWPLAENLEYTNPTVLTAASDGGPVGDPRWVKAPSGIFDHTAVNEDIVVTNYPNPFDGSTTIKYTVERPTQVRLSVYDLSGREVKVLVNRPHVEGTYQVEWSGTNNGGEEMPAGIYIYKVQTDNKTMTRKMIKMK